MVTLSLLTWKTTKKGKQSTNTENSQRPGVIQELYTTSSSGFFSFQYTRTLSSTTQNLREILCKTTEDGYFGWSLEGSPRVFTYQTSSKDFEPKQKPWVSGKENYWYTEGRLTQYSWRSFMNNLIIFTDRESNSSTISYNSQVSHTCFNQ